MWGSDQTTCTLKRRLPTHTSGLHSSHVLDALDLADVLRHSMPLTMAPEAAIRFTAEQTLGVIDRDVPGVIVECACGAVAHR